MAANRRRGHRSTGGQPGVEGLESRALLAADDILVGLVGHRIVLTLDPAGTALTNLSTAYASQTGVLTITAASVGGLSVAAAIPGITIDPATDTIAVDLRKLSTFAGISVVGNAGTDSVTIGPRGVNLAAMGRGAAAQGVFIDTGTGPGDTIAVAGPIVAKGTGTVRLVTQGEGVTHGIQLASTVATARGSQAFQGAVTLLNGVALEAGDDISFASTIDGFGRLRLSAGRTITLAGDVGSRLPLQGLTFARAGRAVVSRGLVLDGSGTAPDASGLVIGANAHHVVFASLAAARTISGFGGAGIRFAGGSHGSRIIGLTSTSNGAGLLVGPGDYRGTFIAGNSFSDNVGNGVSLAAARRVTIGGRTSAAANEIVSNGGFGVAATGQCLGSVVVGNAVGNNAFGQIRNYLASTPSGSVLVMNATGLRLPLNKVGWAAYRAQKSQAYSFDVHVEAFAVSARSTGWLNTRTGTLDINAAIGFLSPPETLNASGMRRFMLGSNSLAASLTPLKALPGLDFAGSIEDVGSDSDGRHYRAVVGATTFAGMIPLSGLVGAPSVGSDGSPVSVDVWVNAKGMLTRVVGAFAGGRFEMSLRGQGVARFLPASGLAQAVDMTAADAHSASGQVDTVSVNPLLPGLASGVSGVQVGRSMLVVPLGDGVAVPTDWYFPTQVDGTINPQGVIWLQHASGASGSALPALAGDLARQTNSIVVAPSLPATMPWSLAGAQASRAVASLFEGDRSALTGSAAAAGFDGVGSGLLGRFVLAGHSAGGGFTTAVAADYVTSNPSSADLAGVIMVDGVSPGAFNGSGSFATQVAALDSRSIPIYQVAAPAQLWNAYGATTNALLTVNPGRFRGVVLAGGSRVDAPRGVLAAGGMLSAGWINDLYAHNAPNASQYGFYAGANQPLVLGDGTALALPSPIANTWSAGEWQLNAELAALGGLSGFEPGAAVNGGSNGLSAVVTPPQTNGVTGVRAGRSSLAIPVGAHGFTTSADWYFPTQADGRGTANGVVWFQRGELSDEAIINALAHEIAQQTNSIVVLPTIRSFEIPTQPGCFLGGASMPEAVAGMFLGDRGALTVSAAAAGYQGVLPEQMILAGHRAGGGFAAEVAAHTVANGAAADLLGVVMVDGVAAPDRFAPAVAVLDSLGVPIYQIASPPQAANAWGQTTEQLALLRPDLFVGVQLDAAGDSDIVITLATGWFNDLYSGAYGPTNPGFGLYGNPNDGTFVPNQLMVLGAATATTLPAPPPVDLNQYAGRWYEQGSVRQPPFVGLVNIASVYTPQPNGTLRVEMSGTSGPNGPSWTAIGSAAPVNAFNTRLDVNFTSEPARAEPGNYWILDYAPDYSWAIVGDPSGTSGTILTREQVIPGVTYDALVARAYQLGVHGTITPTPQYPPG